MDLAGKGMNDILFQTKLRIPFGYNSSVPRSRVTAELDQARTMKLTLVTAPAGFGKSTAMASWALQSGMPVAWLSIDASDNQVNRFWSYVIAALESVIPGLADMFMRYLHTADHFMTEGLVSALVEAISQSGTDFAFVLDDYHLIKDAAIHESLSLMIKYLPANAHLVISSRSKPPFVSARFGISGDMKEIGIDALRFESSEIEAMSAIYDATLSKSELNLLERLTEGWAVGLRLIFDSFNKDNAFNMSQLTSGSGWDSRRIAAYLMEEVIRDCDEEDRAFMLKTSILSQINGPLCQELTGMADGNAILKRLSQSNAFIVPVDSEGNWFRYHHIFSEFLQGVLASTHEFSSAELHERAGNWYERNGYIEEAVGHFLTCGKMGKVVAIIDGKGRHLLKTGNYHILKEWLAMLPDALVKGNHRLCLTYAWALLLSGAVKEADQWMEIVERWHAAEANRSQNEAMMQQIGYEILYFKGMAGVWKNERKDILLSLAKMKEIANEGFAFDYGLNINLSEASLIAGMLGFRGRLRLLDEYVPIYDQARKDVIKQNFGFIPAVLGELFFERNLAENAMTMLARALDEAENLQMAGSFIPAELTLARIMKAKGDIAGTYGIIANAEMKLIKMGKLNFQPILSAFKARIGIERDDGEAVDRWLKVNCLDMHDAPSLHRIYEHITLARALMFKKEYDNAILLLNRLLVFVQREENIYYSIEVLNLLAISYHLAGQTQKAMMSLQESLLLGERDGYERHFIEEGMIMSALLGRFLRQYYAKEANDVPPVSPVYLRNLLLHTKEYCITIKTLIKKKDPGNRSPIESMQPLTKREKEILRFLGSELTNAEIALTLDISLNTVKVNCTNIYRKLNVKKREQAVLRARELNIIK